MAATRYSETDLKRELNEFAGRNPNLAEDEVFIVWFLRAFVVDNEETAIQALCGGSNDKAVDAVLIDDRARVVFIIQGKYRKRIGVANEKRNDVLAVANLAGALFGNDEAFGSLADKLAPDVLERLKVSRKQLLNRGYALQLHYVTTGKCSKSLYNEAERTVRINDNRTSFQMFDGKRLMLLLADYLDGVAPPVPSLDLDIESGSGVSSTGVFNRFDKKTDIESWVFSMSDVAIAGLFDHAGPRLFARNVRGFLGSTEINRGMEVTLSEEPEFFWYYNNGVTIVCDDAKHESSRGREILRVANPQVINGQQTTRTLARTTEKGRKASVLVRVIRVPRDDDNSAERFETLVSKIVQATNWQNAIRPSDLMSNDRRQIEIERHLRKIGYFYLRKRMTKGEARQIAGVRKLYIVKKEEFAQVVAASDLDPAIVREGREALFEEPMYDHVFPSSDPNYYLSRLWLFRRVHYHAIGDRERIHAQWLVLHFLWAMLQPLCRSRAGATAFRRACEEDDWDLLGPLERPIDIAFKSTTRFFRSNRGRGKDAIDLAPYFKRRNLHKDFARFWESDKNRSKNAFDNAWTRFQKTLEEALVQ